MKNDVLDTFNANERRKNTVCVLPLPAKYADIHGDKNEAEQAKIEAKITKMNKNSCVRVECMCTKMSYVSNLVSCVARGWSSFYGKATRVSLSLGSKFMPLSLST